MKVSELRPGMLLRPKDGYVFVRYNEFEGRHEHLERRRPRELSRERYLRQAAFSNKPVVYVCKRPKENPESEYEYRHEIYVPALGRSLRMASEYWRNVEEVK